MEENHQRNNQSCLRCLILVPLVEELLKTREKIQESFTSVPSAPKEVSSSNMAKGSGEDSSLLSADDSQSPTSELNAENAKKSNKWFNLNFKTSMGSTGKIRGSNDFSMKI
ncbi:uncharacterized protein [Physcomitrium patens]|uniref:uncharacterized protein n=1 Tax=Physcomitrium patens TaxID=3218 RepID=UPI003CCCB97F